MASGFRKNKENKKKVVAKVVDFPDFDIQYFGNRMCSIVHANCLMFTVLQCTALPLLQNSAPFVPGFQHGITDGKRHDLTFFIEQYILSLTQFT